MILFRKRDYYYSIRSEPNGFNFDILSYEYTDETIYQVWNIWDAALGSVSTSTMHNALKLLTGTKEEFLKSSEPPTIALVDPVCYTVPLTELDAV